MNKLYWLIISGVSIIVVCLLFISVSRRKVKRRSKKLLADRKRVCFDFGDNKQRMFVGDVV